jgi:TonB family protein
VQAEVCLQAERGATMNSEYHPTIIESRFLIRRLAIQIDFLKDELKRNWIDFKSNPVVFTRRSGRDVFRRLNTLLSTPNAAPACLTAVATIAALVLLALLIERTRTFREQPFESSDPPVELVLLNISKPPDSPNKPSIGKDGPGRVGFQNSKGEGSGDVRRSSGGGGGGGNGNPNPPQTGKLPPPSTIAAAIPIAPPVHPPALPVAGIDIDPALWKDLKAPVYGDPRSKSEMPSKGPGEGEGIGTNSGTGIGEGIGPGVGPGRDGNIGDGPRQAGCCGRPGGGSDRPDGTFRGSEVEQRARLLYKPEPQYTEEARRNQITGTVMLRVVFSSAGEVVQIRAVRPLPFGLTERAIAAARQIKFVPAMKGGRAVSVFMQLEYNFNLY